MEWQIVIKEREEILEKSKKYYINKNNSKNIIPGIDYIPASGKVVDEEDLANIIDASLDMWLT